MVRPMPKTCEKCGRLMPDGALAYEVWIQVAADFDGVLPVAEAEADLPGQMHDLVAAMEHADPDRLLREVVHSERHLLCPECRERYLANPLNLPLDPGLAEHAGD